MSSTPDPSSSAAQGAPQTDELPERKTGFFARLFGTTPKSDTNRMNGIQVPPPEDDPEAALPVAGMSNLRRLRVEDVAIPRVEIISVSCDMEQDDLVAVFRESGLTRLPVYDGTLDTPIGMVHLKDVALRFGFNGGGEGFSLRTMLRPLLYAPPSMPIGVLLQKMQTDRTHMALVIDEYGGVDGLVTIEDLIEQVIGEIEDEHDVEEDLPWVQEKPGSYLALSRASLEEFEAEAGLKLLDEGDEDEIDTLGGLVFVLTGRVPVRGEVIPHPSGAEFEVVDADPRRIKRLRVRLPKGG
ncbi:HlyC/CorC family transporter [Rhodophyticola sp. CCM32]|uniref:hemolysin family protein n=1 Tax=Rhodophyticola sp. CCM32 TaxID=2916397 RepID=UPI00107F9BA3|nr:hemolysin family protein [Rhodophyticola sp. CCM32]QBY01562.1 HlyC/CorC family transporter [Rhodophyticola sp. CCM32]